MTARFTPPVADTLTAAQRRVYDATRTGKRGAVPANVQAWLPSPEMADRAQHLGAFLRYDTSLPPRLSELAILVVAHRWTCAYEWATHAGEAARAGIAAEVIAAIGRGQTPEVGEADARMVVAVAAELAHDGRLTDETFAAADMALGRVELVELVGLIGYYTMVAFTLNAFDVPVPDGAPQLP